MLTHTVRREPQSPTLTCSFLKPGSTQIISRSLAARSQRRWLQVLRLCTSVRISCVCCATVRSSLKTCVKAKQGAELSGQQWLSPGRGPASYYGGNEHHYGQRLAGLQRPHPTLAPGYYELYSSSFLWPLLGGCKGAFHKLMAAYSLKTFSGDNGGEQPCKESQYPVPAGLEW